MRASHLEWLHNERLHVTMGSGERVIVVGNCTPRHFALGYEPDIARMMRVVPDDGTMIDVGANWGYSPIFLASRPGFHGAVAAVEPFPAVYRDLARIVADLGLESMIRTYAAAAAGATNHGEMSMTDKIFGGSNHVGGESNKIRVPVTTIDQIAVEQSLGRVDLLKIDVEEAEADVIAGARETIRRFAPLVVFENWLGEDMDWVLAPFAALD